MFPLPQTLFPDPVFRTLQLESLTISGEEVEESLRVGVEGIPRQWAALTSLTKLELRGHSLLGRLPGKQPLCKPTFH